MYITLNNSLKELVTVLLEMVPVEGLNDILAGMVSLLWPDSSDAQEVWDEIRAEVQALIGQDLDDLVYEQVCAALNGQGADEGLQGVLNNYLAIKNDFYANPGAGPDTVLSTWVSAIGTFASEAGTFQQQGYELLLLPIFAQMANMHLALLRDGVMLGADWGMDAGDLATYRLDLKQFIYNYTQWAFQWYNTGYSQIPQQQFPTNTTIWAAQNNYVRGMILQAMDSWFFWPYFDPDAFASGANRPIYSNREIFSDPEGNADLDPVSDFPSLATPSLAVNYNPAEYNSNNVPRTSAPVALSWGNPEKGQPNITGILVWAAPASGASQPWIQTVQVWNVNNPGNLMGVNPQPAGCNLTSVANSAFSPLTTARGGSGDAPDWVQFVYEDPGVYSPPIGNMQGAQAGPGSQIGPLPFCWNFPGHVLSSMTIVGVSSLYGANCAIFGFMFAPTPAITGVSPDTANAGSTNLPITINGSGFVNNATVSWYPPGVVLQSPTVLTPTSVTASQIAVTIPSSLLGTGGVASIVVVNPGPVQSSMVSFTLAPAVTSVTPDGITVGGSDQQITVAGSGFASNATISWCPPGTTSPTVLKPTSVNATQVMVTISASLLATAGTASITIVNPGSMNSNPIAFAINRSGS